MLEKFTVKVPGSTSNLGSGFDTLSAALGVYLELGIEVTGGLGIQWPSDWSLPPEENMIEVAFRKACEFLHFQPPGFRIRVSNQIPLKRGLGSSGAAIVGGVRIAEHLSGNRLTPDEVFELAYPLEGHPDNLAASLLGGWVVSWVVKGGMHAEKLTSNLTVRFVAAIPEVVVSTAKARAILPGNYSLQDAVFNVQRSALFVHALANGRTDLLKEATRDCLHQAYRAPLVRGLPALLEREALPEALAPSLVSVTISGSGSTVLAMATADYEKIGQWMVSRFAKEGVKAQSVILDLDNAGVRVVK